MLHMDKQRYFSKERRKMMKKSMACQALQLVIIACLTLGIATSASAFDGQRKGFILGGGIGPGLTSYTQTIETPLGDTTSDRENKFGLQTNFVIGLGVTEQVLVYYSNRVSWFSFENALGNNVTITNGLGGVCVAYYFQPVAPSPYINGTLGLSMWDAPFEEGAEAWYGFGVGIGGGYEFARHYSVEADLFWGKPGKEESGIKASSNALTIRVTINALAY
jgi:hypothetical protein